METLRWFFFWLWLCLKISWSWLRMLALLAFGLVVVVAPLGAFLIWALIITLLLWRRQAFQTQFSPPPAHPTPEEQQQYLITQEILHWEQARAEQPTNRDVLLNLASLYGAHGNQNQAGAYLQQAQQVDPNYFAN